MKITEQSLVGVDGRCVRPCDGRGAPLPPPPHSPGPIQFNYKGSLTNIITPSRLPSRTGQHWSLYLPSALWNFYTWWPLYLFLLSPQPDWSALVPLPV